MTEYKKANYIENIYTIKILTKNKGEFSKVMWDVKKNGESEGISIDDYDDLIQYLGMDRNRLIDKEERDNESK